MLGTYAAFHPYGYDDDFEDSWQPENFLGNPHICNPFHLCVFADAQLNYIFEQIFYHKIHTDMIFLLNELKSCDISNRPIVEIAVHTIRRDMAAHQNVNACEPVQLNKKMCHQSYHMITYITKNHDLENYLA